MKIRRILNPVAQENTYILENDTACLVIDPGSDTSAILAELKASDKPVEMTSGSTIRRSIS